MGTPSLKIAPPIKKELEKIAQNSAANDMQVVLATITSIIGAFLFATTAPLAGGVLLSVGVLALAEGYAADRYSRAVVVQLALQNILAETTLAVIIIAKKSGWTKTEELDPLAWIEMKLTEEKSND